MRLVFLATPEFAVPCLDAVVRAGHEVALVVSQPDRPRGRGRRPRPSPVRARACQLGLPETVLEKGGRRRLYQRILDLRPDCAVVVAFGHILREPLLNGPPLGCVNVHASLLPRWRGPAPIHRAIVAGDRQTGVCTMRLAAGVDTGPVYRCAATPIGEDETAGQLHDRLALLGAQVLEETLAGLQAGTLEAVEQPPEGATHAALLGKEEGTVDFDRPAGEVHDRIRGLDPWPGITVLHGDSTLKLAHSHVTARGGRQGVPGTILALDEAGLEVACAEGRVRIGRIQAPGGRWVPPRDHARGHDLAPGQVLRPRAPVPRREER